MEGSAEFKLEDSSRHAMTGDQINPDEKWPQPRPMKEVK